MSAVSASHPRSFPKAARLLKSRDFKFSPYRRFRSDLFLFVYCSQGHGRLGVSISKKVLKLSTARNRVRRLIRETFRLRRDRMTGVDVHIIAQPALKDSWATLKQADVQNQFDKWMDG